MKYLKFYVKDVKQMKNVIKKISAIAMAFTLLSTGTATIKTIAPQTVNTITASAANGTCSHVSGSWSSWRTTDTKYGWLPLTTITETEYQERACTCIKCGHVVKTQKRHRTKYYSGERTTYGNWIYD